MPRRSTASEDGLDYSSALNQLSDLLCLREDSDLQLNSFEDFVQRIFALSYPDKNFDVWHIHLLCQDLDEVMKKETERYYAAVLPRGHLKCLKHDSLIHMADGTIKLIRDVQIGDEVIGYNGHEQVFSFVTAKENKKDNIFKMKFKSGRIIYATKEHKFMQLSGYKSMPDYCGIPRKIFIKPSIEISDTEIKIMTYLIADGDLKRVSFTNSSLDIKEEFESLCSELNWGIVKREGGFTKDGKGINCSYSISKGVRPWLSKWGLIGKRSAAKYFPDAIMKLPNEKLKMVISRLWATDGAINLVNRGNGKTQINIYYSTTSGKLAYQVQDMLVRFGIYTKISGGNKLSRYKKGGKYFFCAPGYAVTVSGSTNMKKFLDEFDIVSKPSEDIRSFISNTVVETCDSELFPIETTNLITENRWWGHAGRKYFSECKMSRKTVANFPSISYLAKEEINWDDLVSMEEMGEDEVFDIETTSGNYIANGLIVHNSTLIGHAFSIFRMLTCPNPNIIYISYKDSLASEHVRSIKIEINSNPILSKHMVDLRPKYDTTCLYDIEGTGRGRVIASGIYSAKRGMHTDTYVVVDDILRDPENALTFTELEKIERYFNAELMQIPNKTCPLFVVGTVQDENDLLMKMKDRAEFKFRYMPAERPLPDKPEIDVLWGDMYPKAWLDRKREDIGEKAYATEYLLRPVISGEAFFIEKQFKDSGVIDRELRNFPITHRREDNGNVVVAGFDVGKRGDPSHLSIFEARPTSYFTKNPLNNEDEKVFNLVMLHQRFIDNMDYNDQVNYLINAVTNFHIDKMYIDNTRGEMEDRDLPRECILINLTGKNKNTMATRFAKRVESVPPTIRLLDEERFISQILCVRNDLTAPRSMYGHGDSFISIMLAVSVYEDYFGNSGEGVTIIGDMSNLFGANEAQPSDIWSTAAEMKKENNGKCIFCGNKNINLIRPEQNVYYCKECYTEWSDPIIRPVIVDKILTFDEA
jgi:intein/homing endonuclease